MHALYQMVIFPMTWMDFKVTAFLKSNISKTVRHTVTLAH